MKASDIRDLEPQEIEQRIAEEQKAISDLKFRRSVAGLENPILLREKRRDIARFKTILNEKRRASAPDASSTSAFVGAPNEVERVAARWTASTIGG